MEVSCQFHAQTALALKKNYPLNMTHGARAGLQQSGEQKNLLLSLQGFKPRTDHPSQLTDHYPRTASVQYVTARGQ